MRKVQDIPLPVIPAKAGIQTNSVPAAIEDALLDDLNTPLAIAHIHELVGELNRAEDADTKAKLKTVV